MRLLIVVLFVVSVALPASAQQRVALLIGNQDYKPGVGKLVNPFNDIKLVGDALRAVGFDVLKPVKNATRADIFEALDAYTARLSKAGAGAIGFVYYSGHGIASKGANYLIPVDVAKPSSRLLRADGVKHSEVLEILRQDAPKAAHYLVVDACRNELQGARGGKGFVAVKEQSGVLIAFATSPDKTATDVGDGGGPYAKALAAELVQPGVTDLQMFSNVRYAVSRATGGDQVPWTLDGIVRRDRVMFAGAAATTPSMANLKQRLIRKLQPKGPRSFDEQTWPIYVAIVVLCGYLSGDVDAQQVSITVLSSPRNFRAPQPVRLHPTKPYFCFSPMVTGKFSIEPGQPYVSRYRYLVTSATADASWIERQWQQYVAAEQQASTSDSRQP